MPLLKQTRTFICHSKVGLWTQLFLTRLLIFRRLCTSWSQAWQKMEVPKYRENGCACGEAGLAEEMEILAKSWASQILKRFVARLPNQQSSDRFWIAVKSLEASQNEPNLEAFQLSRNIHGCSSRYSLDNSGWMKASQLAKLCMICFSFFSLSCSSLPTHTHLRFTSSFKILWVCSQPAFSCLSHYKVQFMLAACRKITSNLWSKVLPTLSIITLMGFVFVSLVRNILKVYCKEALLKVFYFQSRCTLGCTNAHLQQQCC